MCLCTPLARAEAPDFRGGVARARDEYRAVGREHDRAHRAAMALQRAVEQLVALLVRRVVSLARPARRLAEDARARRRARVVDVHGAVPRAAREPPPVGRERNYVTKFFT